MDQKDSMEKHYKRTKDIYFAAALLALGGYLESVDRTNPRHLEFSFSGEQLDDWELSWVNGNLMVNANHYRDAIQRMKTIVHSR